jgi:serine/threonine protein kinase
MPMEKHGKTSRYTLLPIKKSNGSVLYYACDFSEKLGSTVYKGYPCTLKKPGTTDLTPRLIDKAALDFNKEKPVALKLYDGTHHPSPYQFYASEIGVLNIEGRDALIMDFIDGFHIYPDAQDNPKLKQLTFFQAVDITWQLILGLNHFHYNNTSGPAIVHGDIKGENIQIKFTEIDDEQGKKYKIDAVYLDLDYAKPIINKIQVAQGTPEHIAIEILNGSYSEASDFFALSPILLSIFGAQNPFRKILEFRNSNLQMQHDELIKKLRDITFCTDGLFTHFEKKPELFICQMVEHFIIKMGEKDKENRPSPDAILEFFTSLRQLCLVDAKSSKDRDIYLLRLYVAAQNGDWLKNKKYQNLFISLDKNLQDRLLNLMNQEHTTLLYKAAQESKAPLILMEQLRKNIANYLTKQSRSFKDPSFIDSLFFSPITRKDIHWLISCFEQQNYANYHAPENAARRKKLENYTDKKLALLISIVAEGMIQPHELSGSEKLLS